MSSRTLSSRDAGWKNSLFLSGVFCSFPFQIICENPSVFPGVPSLVRSVTLAMAVSGYWAQSAVAWNRLSALAIMMSIPVVLIFLALNRMLSRGWLLGMTEE
ncbi:MAG: hypothetical protein JXA97_02680 [Anaerolineales bacterium]|nr:hypothetical protein [Anaerolineales bacterium]